MSEHAGPSRARRFVWLVVVPVASALVPWLVLGWGGAEPAGLALLVVGAVPLIGGLAAVRYAFGELVRSWLLAPYVAAAAVFVFVLLAAGDVTSGNRLDFGPAAVTGAAMVVLAVVGGLASYAWAPEPEDEPHDEDEPDDEAEPEA